MKHKDDDDYDDDIEEVTEEVVSIPQSMWTVTKISIPMMISFSMSFILLASAIFSGRLDDDEDHVAATTLITVFANAFSAITFGPLFAIGILVSKLFGEYKKENEKIGILSEEHDVDDTDEIEPLLSESMRGKDKKANLKEQMVHYNKNGIALASTIFVMPTALLAFSKFLLEHTGQTEKVATIAQEYLRVFSIGMYGWGWRVINEQIMFASLKQKPTAIIGVVNFALATVLSYFLGFGERIFPKLGLRGIAGGYVAEAYLTPFLLTSYILIKKDMREVGYFKEWGFNKKRDLKQLAEIAKIAGPMFLSFINEFGAQVVINALMGILGTKELAAQNFMSQFYFFAYFPLISFAQATSQEFGRTYGASEYKNARNFAKGGLISVGTIVGAMCLSVALYPRWMTYLLVNGVSQDDSWFDLLRGIAPISAAGIVFDSLGFNMLQVLRTGGDNIVSTTISASSLWIGLIIGVILGFGTDFGAYGLTAGYTIGLFIRAVLLGMRWNKMIAPENLAEIKQDVSTNMFKKSFIQSLFYCCTDNNDQSSSPPVMRIN